MGFPNNLDLPTVPHKNVVGLSLFGRLMDGEIDGLTDDYIGRADKISVILYTREMKRREEERKKERLGEDFIINITNSFP